ncbi:MAG: ATP-binding protein, partial [Sphingobacteriales bacterium]
MTSSISTPKGFKIIAIRTHQPYEDTNYLKILDPDRTYYFYNNYDIDVVADKIIKVKDVSDDLYHLSNLKVNISAIVGKNGAGKSAILELMLRMLNNLGVRVKSNLITLTYIPRIKADLYFYCDGYFKMEVDDERLEVFKFDETGKRLKYAETEIRLRDYFYTIVLNNSHFAYNKLDFNDEVNWLDPLFFKNDSYQAPIVINPMRTDGNVDINIENHLLSSRLIINLVSSTDDWASEYREIAEGVDAHSIRLTIKKSKRTAIIYELESSDGKDTVKVRLKDLLINVRPVIDALDRVFHFGAERLMLREYQRVRDYVIYKLVSIAVRYPSYQRFFVKEGMYFAPNNTLEYFDLLKKDNSHITFKLKQTLNFLKYGH